MYGDFLRRVRLASKLTQMDLSDITGIRQSHISAYETNAKVPSADTLNKLVVGAGFSLCAKFGDTLIPCPLPLAGWFVDEANPSRESDDPPESGPPLAHDAPMDERLRRMADVLALADAFARQ